jgi:hypothetical protein
MQTSATRELNIGRSGPLSRIRHLDRSSARLRCAVERALYFAFALAFVCGTKVVADCWCGFEFNESGYPSFGSHQHGEFNTPNPEPKSRI